MLTKEEIRKRFGTHEMGPEQIEKVTAISEKFEEMAAAVAAFVPAGREQAIVATKLEEAKFFAVAGIARSP